MKRISSILSVFAAAGFAFFANSAFADDCVALGGVINAGECQVSGNHTASGPFSLDETLHILGTGHINVGTHLVHSSITINITKGDFLMDSGALIDGNVSNGCTPALVGSDITVTLQNGDVDLATGSIIRSDSCSGGAIKITTAATHTIDLDGTVESVGSISGVSNQPPGGGPITIVAGCELTVSDTGLVSSRGRDPGADLVHLEGCTVVIDGIVESTGAGHVLPIKGNHCNLDPAAHPLGGNSFYSACVEIWGNTVTINSIAPHKGEVRTDPIGQRNPGRGWIDVFARNDITINNNTTLPYSVHANSDGTSNSFGGLITVKSSVGKFTASGLAIQANGTGAGSDGGDVIIQAGGAGAAGDVAFGTSTVQALGNNDNNVNTFGGHISARSFNGSLTGSAPGALLTTFPVNVHPGTVLLEACVNDPATGYTGTVTGTETDHGPGAPYCGGTPTFPAVAQWSTGISATQFIANAAACATTQCGGTCTKSGQKFNDLNNNHAKDAGEPGLPGWTITLWNSTQTAVVAVAGNPQLTDASGNYLFTGLAPDTYVVCETPQAGWNQTFPVSGAGIVTCTNTSPTTKGYQFTLAFVDGVCADNGNDFGNNKPSHKSGMKFQDLDTPGTLGVKDATDPPIPGWPINLYLQSDLTTIIQTVNTDASGNYKFTIPVAGNYQVCEGQKAGVTSTQTFPNATSPVPPTETVVSNCPLPNIWGYTFTVTSGTELANDDFGNHVTGGTCKKQTTLDIMNNAFPGNGGPDITVRAFAPFNESVQDAVNNVTDVNKDGYLIIMVIAHADGSLGGTSNQKVVVSKDYFNDANPAIGNKPFGLFGCSVTLTGGGADPAIWVKDTAQGKETTINGHKSTILVADLHGGNSAVGNEADGTERYFRNLEPTGNGVGIKVEGSSNTVHNGVVQHSTGVGFQIDGSSNFVTDTRIYTSGSNGVQVAGDSNQLLKMLIGDIGKGNGADGLNLTGSSNLLQENVSRSNTNDGFRIVSGTNNTLTKNTSGGTASQDNGDCEYEVVAGNINGAGNKANNVTIPGNAGDPFPTGCIGTP